MITNTRIFSPQRRPVIFFQPDCQHFNLWWQGTAFMLALLVVGLALWMLDHRQLSGVSVWAKPLKFSASLALHFTTLAILAAFLSETSRKKPAWMGLTWLCVGAGLFEILYIFLQAARGRASHFNDETALEAQLYALMGFGAVILVVTSFYLGWLLYREHRQGEMPLFKLAAAWGLMLGSVLTLIIAGMMSGQSSHFAGEPLAGAATVPVVGWSTSGGDLRIPHFLATHLMQFLPLLGLWLQNRDIPAGKAKRWLFGFTSLYVAGLSGLFLYQLS